MSDDLNLEMFSHAKTNEIIICIREAQFKYTVAGKFRAEIKCFPNELRSEIITVLRSKILYAENTDIAKYLREIIN